MMPRPGFYGSWAPPNNRMHATRDTNNVMLRKRCGRARDARRWAATSRVNLYASTSVVYKQSENR